MFKGVNREYDTILIGMQNQEMEKKTKMEEKITEIKRFQICDYLFRSYLDCIHTYSVDNRDCIQICETLENSDLCKIRVKIWERIIIEI